MQAKEYALSQNIAYPTDSTFNDLQSGLSSPVSALGGGALDGVDIPTSRHLRKDHGDTESVKGRKRFSKRHSKNGLANF